MGCWGVRAHESDTGLDLLYAAVDKYVRGVKYKTFHVKHVMEIMKAHIVERFVKESCGWESEYIDFFYNYTYPYKFAHAVIIVAECIEEYRRNGKYFVYSSDTGRRRGIKEFIITREDLEMLRTELQALLDPKHCYYESWERSDSFDEWKAHIQMLYDVLSQAISEGGDGDA